MQQFNTRGGASDAGSRPVRSNGTFTGANLTKGLMVVLVAGAMFFAWRMAGPSSALAWNSNLGEARAQSANTRKPMLIYFTADWCPPCREFKATTLANDGVEFALQSDWVLVKVDLSDRGGPSAKVAQSLGVNSIPTFQVYTPDGKSVDSRRGYSPPAVFLSWLETCKQRMK